VGSAPRIQHPDARETTIYSLTLLPGGQGLDVLRTQFVRPLWILMGVAVLIALIACSNLGNLLLARATARADEIGVRLALGAGRARMLRQLLTESFALAAAGVTLGLVLSSVASRQLVKLASGGETWKISMALDARIAGFPLLVTLASILIFGLAPAFAAMRYGLNTALHAGRRIYANLLAGHAGLAAPLTPSPSHRSRCRCCWPREHRCWYALFGNSLIRNSVIGRDPC